MSDYLVWAGEEMEKKYGMNVYFWMDYIMNGAKVPKQFSLETYVKLCEEGKS